MHRFTIRVRYGDTDQMGFAYYRVLRGEGEELLATGHTEHCFLGRDGRPGRPGAALAGMLACAPKAMQFR